MRSELSARAKSLPALLPKWLRDDRKVAILVLAPSIIAVAVFIYVFMGWTLYISVSNWDRPALDLSSGHDVCSRVDRARLALESFQQSRGQHQRATDHSRGKG